MRSVYDSYICYLKKTAKQTLIATTDRILYAHFLNKRLHGQNLHICKLNVEYSQHVSLGTVLKVIEFLF